jgi:hypothetical protein
VSRLHARFDLIEKSFLKEDRDAYAVQGQQVRVAQKATPTLPPPTTDFNRIVNQKLRNTLIKIPTIQLQGQNVKRTLEGDVKQSKINWSLMSIQCGMAFLRDRICPQLGASGAGLLTTFSPEGGVSHRKSIFFVMSRHEVHLI